MPKLKIRNWERFQHYKKRNPPWIKLHFEILSSEDWVLFSDASRVLAIACMLLASRNEGFVDVSPRGLAHIKRVAYLNSDPDLKPLLDSGFFDDASTMLADASTLQANACSEAEAEAETETEKNPPIPPQGGVEPPPKKRAQKKARKYTLKVEGCARAAVEAFNAKFGTSRTANSSVLQAAKAALDKCPDATPEDFRAVVADRVNEDWVHPTKTLIPSLIRAKDFAGHVERVKESYGAPTLADRLDRLEKAGKL